MRTIEVKKSELLAKMKANRTTHREKFLKAQERYRELVIAELDKALQDARHGKPIRTHIALLAPVDNTSTYDRVIGMLEMSMDDTIELDAGEYAMYVEDEWHWKQAWLETVSAYGVM